MDWKIILHFFIIAAKAVWIVDSQDVLSRDVPSCQNSGTGLFENITVSSFTDDNRYIRLNISWNKPRANFSTFELMIDTNCSALYGDRNISVDQHYVIQPNLDRLKHPAEPLLHGCKYEFDFFTDVTVGNQSCTVSDFIDYVIPGCVGEVCECGIANAPYEYNDYKLVMDHIYRIEFKKTDRFTKLSLEAVFDKVWYTNRRSNKTISLVRPEQITFDNANNAFTLKFHDFHGGDSYIVNIELLVDNCQYHFATEISVPPHLLVIQKSSSQYYSIYVAIVFALCIAVTLTLLRTRPQLLEKLRNYLPFVPHTAQTTYSAEPFGVLPRTTKEVINSQYTPLEFVVNAHKFDEFEIPRNRVVLVKEIGGGAFGKVFKAELYDYNNKPGYIFAAAKKAIDNAPSEEISDFLAEIETMKKIANFGGHPNVIRIMASVTIDTPYLMIMELVPCGSLKSYLTNLRNEWEERKRKLRAEKNNRHFFPDNMVVENYLPTVTVSECEANKLKYSDLAFDNYSGSINSSETNSYIMPDTPSTPGSPCVGTTTARRLSDRRFSKPTRPKLPNVCSPACFAPQSPNTPNSISSCGLQSATETLLTPLNSAPPTPLIDIAEDITEKVKPVLDSKELQNFALQIANGMAFLESIDITHRDLAARNILVSEDKVLKISDFGMARFGVYINSTQKRQPLRWMAPEAIECRRCDSKTDVWSFGVVLWEIGSLGAFPYKDLSNEQVIAHILQGKRLERPETCTDQVYDLMQRCWQKNADDRPTFKGIAKQLDATDGKIYVDFNKISPKYIFPPTQEEVS